MGVEKFYNVGVESQQRGGRKITQERHSEALFRSAEVMVFTAFNFLL